MRLWKKLVRYCTCRRFLVFQINILTKWRQVLTLYPLFDSCNKVLTKNNFVSIIDSLEINRVLKFNSFFLFILNFPFTLNLASFPWLHTRKIEFRIEKIPFKKKRKINGHDRKRKEGRVGDNLRAQRRTIGTNVSFLQTQHCHGIKNQWHFQATLLPSFSPYPLIPFFFPFFPFFFFFSFFLHLCNSVTWNGHFYSTESALSFDRLVFLSPIEKGKLLDSI